MIKTLTSRGVEEHLKPAAPPEIEGVFTTFRLDDGLLRFPHLHRKRLSDGAAALGISAPEDPLLLLSDLLETYAELPAALRVRVAWLESGEPWLEAVPIPDGEEADLGGIVATILNTRRVRGLHAAVKRFGWSDIPAATQELAGMPYVDEGFVLTQDGDICEGTRSNIFWFHDDRWQTPALSSGCLPGVVRHAMLEHLADLGATVETNPGILALASEIVITNAVRGPVPVVLVADHAIGTGIPGPEFVSLRRWWTTVALTESFI